jgi:DNA-binding NarL/FixJ family response regulator
MTDDSPVELLVVDDEARCRRALTTALRTFREVTVVGEAADGDEAVEMCRRLHPAVVIMDVIMPRMDGITAASAIKAVAPSTGVILMTLYGGVEFDAKRAGADVVLTKADSVEEVVDAVLRLAGRSAAGARFPA